ncbi:MAG TPA: ATP-dependent DNA helicase RecG [Hyphomicrobiales bacterium]|nr:ATP-dependent DNA helicase RecG [Hyphomicrobiales bacterium]
MRPPLLNPLFVPLASLPGLGDKTALALGRLLGPDARAIDALFHAPSGMIDRRLRPPLSEAPLDTVVTLRLAVEEHRPAPPRRPRAPWRVVASDGTGLVTLVFFNVHPGQIEKLLPKGATRWVSGKLEMYDGMLQMVHPDRVVPESEIGRLAALEPVYPLVEGVTQSLVTRAVRGALARLPDLPEWLDPALLKARRWPGFGEALGRLHAPEQPEDIAAEAPGRTRLAYDELLAGQLALALMRAHLRGEAGRASPPTGAIAKRLEAALPFRLTKAQKQAVAEIGRDLAEPTRMSRLLQGDVGAGKTVVALMAMAQVAENGRQSALMAPTDVLARQHLKTIAPLAEAVGLRVVLLTGREKGREREAALAALASGEAAIAVGTHALFQDEVQFHDLAFTVIDEQHRFGVQQRLALAAKGRAVDVLVMTATPIPRTLVLTYYGDMEVSALRERPAGRPKVETRLVSSERIGEVVAAVGRAVSQGARVYWVCPLVEESEATDLAAAEERFAALEAAFPGKAALVHGRMKGADKDRAMARFAQGEVSILVATTVIEVGVDVPEASVMVIEHAERFGLAQLHQLRGRIGRGTAASTCLLLYRGPLGPVAEQRLKILRETDDGFRIAEEDLRLRGEGEVLGTRQSGMPGFRLAADRPDLADLLETARKDAALVLAADPGLAGPRGDALRHLLYLFRRDEAARSLRAG